MIPIMFFEGTHISIKVYGKSELAEKLGISLSKLRRELIDIEELIKGAGAYKRRNKTLRPSQVKAYLVYYGYSEEKIN